MLGNIQGFCEKTVDQVDPRPHMFGPSKHKYYVLHRTAIEIMILQSKSVILNTSTALTFFKNGNEKGTTYIFFSDPRGMRIFPEP